MSKKIHGKSKNQFKNDFKKPRKPFGIDFLHIQASIGLQICPVTDPDAS
jgi:hypothetical protein